MRRRARGFSLIEVLVAVLVLGIGMLGVAALQSVTLGMNQGAYLRSQASLLARDLADRMRANPTALANGDYDLGAGASSEAGTACETPTGCTSAALAAHDLDTWLATVATRLPDAEAIVCTDTTPGDGSPGAPACNSGGDTHVIKIWWRWRQDGTTGRFTTEVRP